MRVINWLDWIEVSRVRLMGYVCFFLLNILLMYLIIIIIKKTLASKIVYSIEL